MRRPGFMGLGPIPVRELITCANDPAQYETCLRYADALDVPEGNAVETVAVVGAP